MSDDQPATTDGLSADSTTAAAADSTAGAPTADAGTATAGAPTADAGTATAPAAPATADPGTVPAAPATPATDAGTAPAPPLLSRARRRSLAVVAGLSRIVRFAFVVALFAVGVAFGYQTFLNQAQVAAPPGPDPATAGNQPAPVIRELIAAVGTNDADRIRAAMPSEPYKLFTSEMQRWEFKEVTSVETLATYEDGTRTATSFVMVGRDLAGNPIAMTIVAETKDGNIVGFK